MHCTFTFYIHHLLFFILFDPCVTITIEFWCIETKNNFKKSLSFTRLLYVRFVPSLAQCSS